MKYRVGRMSAVRVLIVLTLGLLGSVNAVGNHYIIAPATLRLDCEENFGVAMDGAVGGKVTILVQDFPGKTRNITRVEKSLVPGHPELLQIYLDSKDFPADFLTPDITKYVSLTAYFPRYRKEAVIPISVQSGYVFIQTDKPIYTPRDRASIRIIHLNEDSILVTEELQLQIKNPEGLIVEQKKFSARRSRGFVTHVYKFPLYPLFGEWTITVFYGHNLKQISTVNFNLEEYVLPMFSVELETPDVILPHDEKINIKVSSRYTYGKKVNGMVTFQLGVKKHLSGEEIFLERLGPYELVDGSYDLEVPTIGFRQNREIGWFPEIQDSTLFVEATVVDLATGNEEEAMSSKSRFSKTPFIISFKRCLGDFKPGLTSVVDVDISYVNGEPAEDILMRITAVADSKKPVNISHDTSSSDKDGKVSFEIRPETDHKSISITLKTADPRYAEAQTEGKFTQKAFGSTKNAFIALARNSPQRLKPREKFGRVIYFEPPDLQNIYYLVAARGRILKLHKLPNGKYKNQALEFEITHDMVPNFRVLIFAQHNGQLLVDSLKIDIENECSPESEVSLDPQYSHNEPGNNGKIIIRGSGGTLVGILGVDEAVYSLSKKDILTKNKIFEAMGNHDLGCGTGGGLTVDSILGRAGIILATNLFHPTNSFSCVESKRRKRAVVMDIVDSHEGFDRHCCSLGLEQDMHYRSCAERATVVETFFKEDSDFINCSSVFLECCLYSEKEALSGLFLLSHQMVMGKTLKNVQPELKVVDAETEGILGKNLKARKYFPETWLFQELTIGPDGREERGASLPDSITTWVLQAVSVSPAHGICVAQPRKVEVFKKIFLHLNLPYSVIRNEQVEIQATVFNYDSRPMLVNLYLYGVEGLCSGVQPGNKSETKTVFVDGLSSKTVVFPVIPLRAEVIPITVSAFSAHGTDMIEKKLYVEPEGFTVEKDIPVKLDPTNVQKREKRRIDAKDTFIEYDDIDVTQNHQLTAIKLCLPEDYVPGTESCSISAVGDTLGPAIETAVKNPENLLTLPKGCGEQNIMRLGPTIYAMKYLKDTGKLTGEAERIGYEFMRAGYDNQLIYRKEDGSYAVFRSRPASTWLTAFVMKVFCQASELIYIDQNVLRTGIKWLIAHQSPDGSFTENHPVFAASLMGGVEGRVPLTAFVLIALEECKDEHDGLHMAKKRAVSYLESNLRTVKLPLSAAIVAYALALSKSDLQDAAKNKLMGMQKYDRDNNWRYWPTQKTAQDIQTSAYALLTQLQFNDMETSTSIVNWLNTKQLRSGAMESTQDTVIALQALTEYAIKSKLPSMNLTANISASNDRYFQRVMYFNEHNALVLQDERIKKFGGSLFINTVGRGLASMSVKLRYNVLNQPKENCKFDVSVNVTDESNENLVEDLRKLINEGGKNVKRRDKKVKYNVKICLRHLDDRDAEMSIVDVKMFSGFTPVVKDLKKIARDLSQIVQKFEVTKKGIIFYLEKVPSADKFCFFFGVSQEFVVENARLSSIQVYEYYNPASKCTKVYKPAGSFIRTVCSGLVCQCAEGGCPAEKPFAYLKGKKTLSRRTSIKSMFCAKFDYVWKGTPSRNTVEEGGFWNISFQILDVIKAGTERKDIVGENRILLAKDNCRTAQLFVGLNYLILGKDGQSNTDENGEIWHRYFLDETSIVYDWTDGASSSIKSSKNKIFRDIQHVTKELQEIGCDD